MLESETKCWFTQPTNTVWNMWHLPPDSSSTQRLVYFFLHFEGLYNEHGHTKTPQKTTDSQNRGGWNSTKACDKHRGMGRQQHKAKQPRHGSLHLKHWAHPQSSPEYFGPERVIRGADTCNTSTKVDVWYDRNPSLLNHQEPTPPITSTTVHVLTPRTLKVCQRCRHLPIQAPMWVFQHNKTLTRKLKEPPQPSPWMF